VTATAAPPAAGPSPAAAAGSAPSTSGAAGARLPRLRARRRPALLAAGVALVALGALSAAYLVQVVSASHPVVAVVRPVAAGAVLQRGDLAVAQVQSDPALAPVPGSRIDALVGKRAAVALPAGSLLTADAVTDALPPATGQSLVGVALSPAQLPAEPLAAGDRVRLVDTPGSAGAAASGSAAAAGTDARGPHAVPAVVVGVAQPREDGTVVVDVTVPAADAAGLAASASTGRVALVLDSRER